MRSLFPISQAEWPTLVFDYRFPKRNRVQIQASERLDWDGRWSCKIPYLVSPTGCEDASEALGMLRTDREDSGKI